MKGLRKFQVDIPINATVEAVQSSVHLYCDSHVGRQKNAHQPISPYNIIENSPTSLAYDSVFIGPNNFKFDTKTGCVVLYIISELEQIDHNLHNHVFDDVICKPSIPSVP